jgi:hypothetical protein
MNESLLAAKQIPIAPPLSSSLNISPMTAAPSDGPSEAPIDCKNLQKNREGILCAAARPAEPITNKSEV